MPRVRIQTRNTNLTELSNGAKKKVRSEVVDEIKDPTTLCRDQNNLIKGSTYRLDAKKMTAAGTGYEEGDYKIDIQTVTRQKSLSETVVVVFIAPNIAVGSLQDLKDAIDECMDTRDIYRVT